MQVAAQVPVVVTEMGHGIQWAEGLMKWIEQQHGTISYLPWTWNTWGATAEAEGAGESLVSDYATGKPTSWGQAVKTSFANARYGLAAAAADESDNSLEEQQPVDTTAVHH